VATHLFEQQSLLPWHPTPPAAQQLSALPHVEWPADVQLVVDEH
jgi:hypothetical protein